MQIENRIKDILYIPYENLLLDQSNPRLAGESSSESQEAIISRIYKNEELDSLAGSLAIHGYLPEEPLILIPEEPSAFEKIKKNQDSAINYKFIVVEGNRRLTSIKLLLDEKLRVSCGVDEEFPAIVDEEVRNSLKILPVILYRERQNVDAYLGIRHIAGNKKWEAYAKARFIYHQVKSYSKENKTSIADAITEVQRQVADTKGTIRKLFVYFSVFQTIDDAVTNYKSKHIKERFSLIEVALGANGTTSIASYVGLKPFRFLDLDKEEDFIPTNKIEHLTNITQWIFGIDEKGSDRLITDSRNISNKLNPVVGNEEAEQYLLKHRDLEAAYELTDGEELFVERTLNRTYKSLHNLSGVISKYSENKSVTDTVSEIERVISEFKLLLHK